MSSIRSVSAIVVAMALAIPVSAHADDPSTTVLTFDADAIGSPPAAATVAQGEVVVVEQAPGDRAVQLSDTATTRQSRLVFQSPAAPARRFQFDFQLTSTSQPSIIALHGAGASASLGLWRFLIGRSSLSGEFGISAYDGRAWRQIGLLPDLTTESELTIYADLTTATVAAGGRALKTSIRASSGSGVTGIEFASSGTAAVGTGMRIDDLAVKQVKQRDRGLVQTLAFTTDPGRGSSVTDQVVSTTTAEPASAEVNWGQGWEPASITHDGAVWSVRGSHTFDALGPYLLQVRVTDTEGVTTDASRIYTVGFEKVLVAKETLPMQARFPDITRRSDGVLQAVYYASAGHTRVNGVIKTVTSTDNGTTWGTPRVIVRTEADARDPKIATLADGSLLVTYFETVWNADGSSTQNGVFTTVSTDQGQTWSTPGHVDSALAAPGFAAVHGPPVQLANGDVLLALYGSLAGEGSWRATVIRSTDGGRTFDRSSEVTIAADPQYRYAEPNLTVLPSGEIVSLIRLELSDVKAQLTRSFDGGHTWTTPEITDIPARSHHQLLTSSGKLLLTYGDPTVSGRPTFGRMIDDPAGSWNSAPATLIYDSGNGDQANPSSIELAPGQYLTLGYNVATGELFGVRTSDADYG